MNKNINLIIAVIFVIFAVSISYSIIVFAQESQKPGISYPVEKLGNCGNETECKIFCDKPMNMIPCVNFAEENGLISKDEVKKTKAFIQASMKGPGNCSNKDECEAFCNNPKNAKSCISFAKENGLMLNAEIEEAEKVIIALEGGAQLPGGCANKKQCEAYCDNPDNMEECIVFAEKAGFIPQNELKDAKKAMQAMRLGIRPPGNCRGKKQCEAYCDNPDNMEECIVFAEKAGFIPPEEAEMARKMMPLMKAGKMPGGCRGKEECEFYCLEESHNEECANFALEAGLMKPEEFEMFKKTGGKGPGDCRGKDECETFCNNPENQEICFGFAKEHNLIPQEEIEKMKSGMEQMKQMMPGISGESGRGAGVPPEIARCLKSTVGEEVLNKVQSGQTMPSQQLGEQMRKCFEQFIPQGQGGLMGSEEKFDEGDRRIDHQQSMPIESEIENREFEKFRKFRKEDFKGNDSKEIEEIREKFPKGAPSQEMIQKMIQEGNFPQEFQKGEIPKEFPDQYIPEQYKGIIEQHQQYPNQMPLEIQMQYQPKQEFQQQPIYHSPNESQYQPQQAPIQEQIPPSSGILSPISNFGASIFQILMGL